MDGDLLVIGAGAGGLWAAAAAARLGLRVVLVEKTSRAGTKILASGGNRCNLTTTLGADAAARLFGDAERFLQPAMRALPPSAVVDRFHALGVPTVTEPHLEKVFPASQRAIDVRDALLEDALRAGVTLLRERPVRGVQPIDGGWRVLTDPGVLRAPAVLLATGGQSYPATGTTGDGWAWLRALGLPIVPPVPALVPVRSPEPWVKELTGISVQDVEVRLHDPQGRIVGRRARPVVFTHHGISGPGAMDLSHPVARAARDASPPGWALALDLLPERSLSDVQADLTEAVGTTRLVRVLGESLPARLRAACARQAGLDDDNPVLAALPKKVRHRLADALKGLRVPVQGTLGWDKAEVTGGGLDRGAVDRTTMAVRGHPGLYVIGELLDAQGPIGGLNFQAAFATGELAARAVARAR